MSFSGEARIERLVAYRNWASGINWIQSEHKRSLDVSLASLLSAAASPIVAAARLAVIMTNGSPSLVRLPRAGRGGEEFLQQKVRSMVVSPSHSVVAPGQKRPDDPRIIPVGGFLRRTSIDELTQLGNVLAGDMSLVGPRPKVSPEVDYLGLQYPGFREAYCACAPGITGLEQISGRGGASAEQRARAAMAYVEQASLALDIWILRQTVGAVLSCRGAY